MRYQKNHHYYVYIVTNKHKTVLYTGVTNSLITRLCQHREGAEKGGESFTAKYKTYYLLHFESFDYIREAIAREKQIKGWKREKKEALIKQNNPEWRFLNEEVTELFRMW